MFFFFLFLVSLSWNGVSSGDRVDLIDKLVGSDGNSERYRFGWKSGCMYNDYVAVGAIDESGSNSGSVYIFKYNNTTNTFNQTQILQASDASSYAYFVKVSMYDNYLLVGASGVNQAYIFKLNESSQLWYETQILVPQNTSTIVESSDNFGTSVAIIENYAIVGDGDNDDIDSGSGAVFVYFRSDFVNETNETNEWRQIQILYANDGSKSDYFGRSVSMSIDKYNNNNIYIISGAYLNDAAYIFELNNNTNKFSFTSKLNGSDTTEGDWFGYSVSISNNYAVVGASKKNNNSGNVYIYYRNNSNWNEIMTLTSNYNNEHFGFSVSIYDNLCMIGTDTSKGRAHIYQRSVDTNEWQNVTSVTAMDGKRDDYFGYHVSLFKYFGIVTAPYDDNNNISDTGSAYIYSIDESPASTAIPSSIPTSIPSMIPSNIPYMTTDTLTSQQPDMIVNTSLQSLYPCLLFPIRFETVFFLCVSLAEWV